MKYRGLAIALTLVNGSSSSTEQPLSQKSSSLALQANGNFGAPVHSRMADKFSSLKPGVSASDIRAMMAARGISF